MVTDVTVIILYFIAIFTIGIRAGRKQKNMEDYALGGRNLPWWAILASILAAEISAATFLGAPGEGYAMRNLTYAQLCIGTILGRIIVGKLFLKPYYDYKVVSIYEYLDKRFGICTQRMASALFLISRVLASGARLYFAGILLVIGYQCYTGEAASPNEIVWMYAIALIIITISTTIYTVIGGLKAVVWTDVLQACILMLAILSAIWILVDRIPWVSEQYVDFIVQNEPYTFFSLGVDFSQNIATIFTQIFSGEYTIWSAFLGATFVTMATHGTDQDMVQRMLASNSSSKGTKAVIISGLIDLPIVIIFLVTGILLYIFYQTNSASIPATRQLEVFPHFIIYELPAGVRGLLIAGLLATAMGSLSTALNSLATTFTKDWYQGVFRPNASEKSILTVAKISTAAFAMLLIAVGIYTSYYVAHHPEARIIPIALGIFGYTYGSLLGIFLVGMLTRTRGRDITNCFAMLFGFVVVAILSKLIILPCGWSHYIPHIAFPWRVTIGTCSTMLFALSFSHTTKKTELS